MPTLKELGLQIGDNVRFPIFNRYTRAPVGEHVAKIVGPPRFPNSAVVYLHSSLRTSPIIFNQTTGEFRFARSDEYGSGRWEPNPHGDSGEIQVDVFSIDDDRFERVETPKK